MTKRLKLVLDELGITLYNWNEGVFVSEEIFLGVLKDLIFRCGEELKRQEIKTIQVDINV